MVDHETHSRLLAKLVRELLATETFATLACLTEALKCRCARLKIRWTNDAITDAYRLIASNHPLVTPRAGVSARHDERVDAPPISRAEASQILADIYARCADQEARRAG